MFDSQIESKFGNKHKLSFHHSEETESQLDPELHEMHELSPDCEAIMGILYPDIDYASLR